MIALLDLPVAHACRQWQEATAEFDCGRLGLPGPNGKARTEWRMPDGTRHVIALSEDAVSCQDCLARMTRRSR